MNIIYFGTKDTSYFIETVSINDSRAYQEFLYTLLIFSQVIQVYIAWVHSKLPAPQRQLVGFQRTTLSPRQEKISTFIIKGEQMALWDDNKGFIIQPGKKYI